MAEGELVTIAHQDDMYHRDYSARLLAAHRRYPDMTVFTTDYVIVKQGALITGDAMLWIKRILRTPLRFPQMNDRAWVKKLAFVWATPYAVRPPPITRRCWVNPLYAQSTVLPWTGTIL